ncbi:unnamed protein product [Caenorhabditis auriculariae]|uniref:Uncharacterized protein n=1 Tax=Caenorhabditis auriculariae TaxID=2777116 RepID=A0A8S1HM66_9PELO|nr:unnamed protein product [Caenorhabditis auriculariae]
MHAILHSPAETQERKQYEEVLPTRQLDSQKELRSLKTDNLVGRSTRREGHPDGLGEKSVSGRRCSPPLTGSLDTSAFADGTSSSAQNTLQTNQNNVQIRLLSPLRKIER